MFFRGEVWNCYCQNISNHELTPLQGQQSALLTKKLPIELLREIFDKLGPATRRVLGATCISLYDVFKTNYFKEGIVVNFQEAAGAGLPTLQCANSPEYIDILASWIVPSLRGSNDAPWQRHWLLNDILVATKAGMHRNFCYDGHRSIQRRADGSVCLWYGGRGCLEVSVKEKFKKAKITNVNTKEGEVERNLIEAGGTKEGGVERVDIYEWED